jgi:hypothetical protein
MGRGRPRTRNIEPKVPKVPKAPRKRFERLVIVKLGKVVLIKFIFIL